MQWPRKRQALLQAAESVACSSQQHLLLVQSLRPEFLSWPQALQTLHGLPMRYMFEVQL